MSDEKINELRVKELEELLEQSERKSDILTNLLREATVEFQHAVKQISTSEANFRSIIENAPEAICIFDAKTHTILECNPYTLRWLGYTKRELLEKRVEDIFEKEVSEKEISKVEVEHNSTNAIDGQFIKKNGERVLAEVTWTKIFFRGCECLVGFARDITERRKLEELSRYKELFDNVIDPVIICDAKGKILEVNDVACERFEYNRQVLLQLSFRDLISLNHHNVFEKVKSALTPEKSIHFEVDIRTRTGKFISFEFHARIITYLSESAILSVGRDLSARKRMEEIIVRHERLRAVGELALGVAHNFNNLLQIITSSAEVLRKKLCLKDKNGEQEPLQNILEACSRGVDIVNRIKEFSGKSEIRDEKIFDLNSIISEAIKLAKPLWFKPHNPSFYQVIFDTSFSKCFVRGNPSEIYEIVLNLIKNALEAMPNGGKLLISSQVDENVVTVNFSDTGHGISPEHLQKIFEPFFTTKGPKSSGLGLSSSYGIIKKHGGEITVRSYPGRGTTFSIHLPLVKKEETTAHAEIQAKRASFSEEGTISIRALLVDDEVHILKMIKMWFDDTDIKFDTAKTAEEALRAVDRSWYDVIICDYGMEEVNGLQLCNIIKRRLKQLGRDKPLMLLCTGLQTQLGSQALESAGIEGILKKPISIQKLSSLIRDMIYNKDVTSLPSLSGGSQN